MQRFVLCPLTVHIIANPAGYLNKTFSSKLVLSFIVRRALSGNPCEAKDKLDRGVVENCRLGIASIIVHDWQGHSQGVVETPQHFSILHV